MTDMFRRMSLPSKIALGAVVLTLLACGGSGGSSSSNPVDDQQRTTLTLSGSGATAITVQPGGTFDLVVAYDPNKGSNNVLDGTPANRIVFEYESAIFEDIADVTIPTPGEAYTTTITVSTKDTASEGTFVVRGNLRSGSTVIGSQSNSPFSVTVEIPEGGVAQITMNPANISNTESATGSVTLPAPSAVDQSWNLQALGTSVTPSTPQTVLTGGSGFDFTVSSQTGDPGFGSVSWIRESDGYQVLYEFFFHPDSALLFGSDAWEGTVSDGDGGTATLRFEPLRSDLIGDNGWTSNVRVRVIFTEGNFEQTWSERLVYPFTQTSGSVQRRVTFASNGSGGLDATMQELTNAVVTKTWTGALSPN